MRSTTPAASRWRRRRRRRFHAARPYCGAHDIDRWCVGKRPRCGSAPCHVARWRTGRCRGARTGCAFRLRAPVSPLTPSRNRSCRVAGGGSGSWSNNVPFCPAPAGRRGGLELRAVGEGQRRDRLSHVIRLPRSRPEPSFNAPSAMGTPSSLSFAVVAGMPVAVVPALAVLTPSSFVRSSAVRLSLDESIEATIALRGGDVTCATSTAPAGAVPVPDEPTSTPRLRRSAASCAAALRAGSSTGVFVLADHAEPVVHRQRPERSDLAVGAVGVLPGGEVPLRVVARVVAHDPAGDPADAFGDDRVGEGLEAGGHVALRLALGLEEGHIVAGGENGIAAADEPDQSTVPSAGCRRRASGRSSQVRGSPAPPARAASRQAPIEDVALVVSDGGLLHLKTVPVPGGRVSAACGAARPLRPPPAPGPAAPTTAGSPPRHRGRRRPGAGIPARRRRRNDDGRDHGEPASTRRVVVLTPPPYGGDGGHGARGARARGRREWPTARSSGRTRARRAARHCRGR